MVLTSGLVTFITARHHIRTSNSSVEARSHSACGITDGALNVTAPRLTSALFTDAYHYMGWFLTIPLLTTETLLVMKLRDATFDANVKFLGLPLDMVSGDKASLTPQVSSKRGVTWPTLVPPSSSAAAWLPGGCLRASPNPRGVGEAHR